MANVSAQKIPDTPSKAIAHHTGGRNGITMPAVPVYQKKEKEDVLPVQGVFVLQSKPVAQTNVLQLKGDPIAAEEFTALVKKCTDNMSTHKAEIIVKLHSVLYKDDVSLTPTQVAKIHELLTAAGSNEVEYLNTTLLKLDNLKQENIDQINTFYEEHGDHLLPAQQKIVLNSLRRYGLNKDSAIDAYVDSLAENMQGTEGREPQYQVSNMMLSVNAQLTGIGFPTLPITFKKGLENGNSANFSFQEWKIQIDVSLIKSFDAHMANTIYHEARHSEQFFRMIMMEQIAKKSIAAKKADQDIVKAMHVPAEIVALARAKQPEIDTNFPPEQRMDTYNYHESVYGAKSSTRTATILGLSNKSDKVNYGKYKALPEEVDAWDTGGRVEKSIDKKIITLSKAIAASSDLAAIRLLCTKIGYYVSIVPDKSSYMSGIEAYLEKLKTGMRDIRRTELASGGAMRGDILKVALKHNYLAQAFKLTKISPAQALGSDDREFTTSDWAETGVPKSAIVS